MQPSMIFAPPNRVEATLSLPGIHGIDARKKTESEIWKRSTVSFDPVNSQIVTYEGPTKPPSTDSLNPWRRLDSRQRDKE